MLAPVFETYIVRSHHSPYYHVLDELWNGNPGAYKCVKTYVLPFGSRPHSGQRWSSTVLEATLGNELGATLGD